MKLKRLERIRENGIEIASSLLDIKKDRLKEIASIGGLAVTILYGIRVSRQSWKDFIDAIK